MPIPPPPFPRLHELASPDAAPRRSRAGFLVNVVERVAVICQHQAASRPSTRLLDFNGDGDRAMVRELVLQSRIFLIDDLLESVRLDPSCGRPVKHDVVNKQRELAIPARGLSP